MIVNPTANGWEIITHYAHGLQAAQIGQQIQKQYRPKFWLETLCSIIEHDDKQVNFERNNNVSKSGRPLDFTLIDDQPEDVLEHCKRLIRASRYRSGWVTLMIAQHLEFLYADLIASHAAIRKYFEEIHALKKKIRKVYSINEKLSEEYYQLLRFCDRCSLIISMRQIPAGGREVEINESIGGQIYYLKKTNDVINIRPWIFKKSEFEISTEVYEIDRVNFENSSELQEHLLESSPILKTWQFAQE